MVLAGCIARAEKRRKYAIDRGVLCTVEMVHQRKGGPEKANSS